jgi:hypothetical protein
VADENGNNRRDRREAFDSLTLRVDSTATRAFWAFVHDTLGPSLREATRIDTVTVRVTFAQPLDPGMPAAGAVAVRLLPDSTPVDVAAVWTPVAYDSISRREAAARDSARAAADSTARPDSAAPADTAVRRDTVPSRPARPVREGAPDRRVPTPRPGAAGQPQVGTERPMSAVDTARVAALLAERPKLTDQLIVRLVAPLTPGARYLFAATATNLTGATAESRTVLAVPDTASTAPGR